MHPKLNGVVVGFAVPDEDFETVVKTAPNFPASGQNFGRALLDALEQAGIDAWTIAVLPLIDFPHQRRLFARHKVVAQGTLKGEVVPFVNITVLKHLTRYWSVWRALNRVRRRGRLDFVLVHGLNSALVAAATRWGRRAGVPVVVVVTDAAGRPTPFDGRITRWLKRVDARLLRSSLMQVAGFVVLSEELGRLYAGGRPLILVEGIAPAFDAEARRSETPSRPRVVYAGQLKEEYGVGALLEAATNFNADWDLEFYGRGPLEADVIDAARRHGNVFYGGTLLPAMMRECFSSADVLINPRPVGAEFATTSFPSKLLEYMAAGRPVVTTRLPGIPESWQKHLIFTDENAKGLADSIASVLSDLPAADAAAWEARVFILERYGARAQGVRIRELIEQLAR